MRKLKLQEPQRNQHIIHITINFTALLSSTAFISTHNDSVDCIDQFSSNIIVSNETSDSS